MVRLLNNSMFYGGYMKSKTILYILLCATLLLSSCTKTTISEKDILGDWEAIKGEYQEVSFTVEDNEYRFSAYLGGRLFTDGTWSIKHKDLILKLSTGETVIFKDAKIENGILTFEGGKQQYQRQKTDAQKIDDLMTALGTIQGISFSKPVDTKFTWNFEGIGEKKLKGKMIKATIPLTTDDYTDLSNAARKIVELLTSKGFTSSEYNMTEIQSGAENGPIKVLIKQLFPISYDPETDTPITIKGKKATLEIMCGVVE